MNIIILGCGKVGQTLAVSLEEENGHNITVIDLRYNVIQNIINNYDIMGVAGNGMNVETLKEAGVETADIFIAVTGSDELNLMACLMAKKLGSIRTIARVRTPEYSKNLHLIKEDLGLAMVINPERTAASEIARILRFPSAIEIDTFAKGRIEILKFIIPENSCLDNLQVYEIVSKLNCDILVCGVDRGNEAFIPGGNFVLKSGDAISIVGSIKSVTYFFKKIGIKTNSVKDTIIIGGGMTFTFLKAMGYEVGNSICELDRLDIAKETIEKAKMKGVKLLLPIDTVCGKEFTNDTETVTVDSKQIPEGWQGLDIGPKAIEEYTQELKNAKTVIWNGPLGVFEFEKFAKGTNSIAKVLSELDATTIVGGGDSVAAIEKGGFSDKITHISTGGGASLEFLEGKALPGIEALNDK